MLHLTVFAICIVLALSAQSAHSFRGLSSRWVTSFSRTASIAKHLQCIRGGADGHKGEFVKHVEDMGILSAMIAQASNTHKVLVIDFSATWCGPCQRIAPVFEKLAKEFETKALFVKVCLRCLPFLDC